jgi:hypothetical protein
VIRNWLQLGSGALTMIRKQWEAAGKPGTLEEYARREAERVVEG